MAGGGAGIRTRSSHFFYVIGQTKQGHITPRNQRILRYQTGWFCSVWAGPVWGWSGHNLVTRFSWPFGLDGHMIPLAGHRAPSSARPAFFLIIPRPGGLPWSFPESMLFRPFSGFHFHRWSGAAPICATITPKSAICINFMNAGLSLVGLDAITAN